MSDRFTYSEADKENQRQVHQGELRKYHANWASFWEYKDNHCSQFGLDISVKDTVSVKTRNKDLSNMRGVASGMRTVELLPADLEAYRRTFICSHGRKSRAKGTQPRRGKPYTGCKFKFKATSVYRDGAWQVEIAMMSKKHDHTQKSFEIQREHMPAEESKEESQSSPRCLVTNNTSAMASNMSDQRDASTFSTGRGEDPAPEPIVESDQQLLACSPEEFRQLLLELPDGDTGAVLIEHFSSDGIDCQLPETTESVSSQNWFSETSGEDTISLAPTSEASVYDVDENDSLLFQLPSDQLQLQYPPVSSPLNDE